MTVEQMHIMVGAATCSTQETTVLYWVTVLLLGGRCYFEQAGIR